MYGTAQTFTLLMRYSKLLAICAIFASFNMLYSGLFFLLRSGRKSAPSTSAERTGFTSIVLGFATALKGSSQRIIQDFDYTSAMTSECVVVREFFAREACESVSPKTGELSSNESLETETIQKFLSICLKQYFSSSQDDTKVGFGSSEILNVNMICYFVVVYLSGVVMFLKSDQKYNNRITDGYCPAMIIIERILNLAQHRKFVMTLYFFFSSVFYLFNLIFP